MQVPLFTGGRITGDVRVAQADLEEARYRLTQARELSELDSYAAMARLEAAEASFAASAGTAQQAARAYQIAEIRYREGISTQVELSDSRILLEQASANRALASRDLAVARARVASCATSIWRDRSALVRRSRGSTASATATAVRPPTPSASGGSHWKPARSFRTMSPQRPVIQGTLLISLTLFALTGCRSDNEANAEENNTPVVDVGVENIAVAEQTMLRVGPLLSGSLEPAREDDVRAETTGTVVQSLADNGQAVQKGQLLARIDDTAIRDQWLSARSLVTSATNAATVARRDEERTKRLAEAGAVAERDLDAARQGRIAADAQLEDARARLSLAQRQLDNTQVRAPFAGLVRACRQCR